MLNATATHAGQVIQLRVEISVARLYREDPHLCHLLTHHVPLSDRPTTPQQRREHGIARVLYTWLRIEESDPEAVAADIETLAALGRSEKWKNAIRTWAHIVRHEPDMFQQYGTYTNYAA
jgi:hypothetical protein